jgi:hypothetical protein
VPENTDSPVVLWENESGVRCLSSRLEDGSIEITIESAGTVLERAVFTAHTDAADYAIAAMHSADGSFDDTDRISTRRL